MNRTKVLRKAIKHVKKSQACTLGLEEISELNTELLNMLHAPAYLKWSNIEDVAEEMCDSSIMLDMIEMVYKLRQKEVNRKTKKYYEKLKDAHFSTDDMLKNFMHDLSLLQKIICKSVRKKCKKCDIENQAACVHAWLQYMESMIPEDLLNKYAEEKIARLKKRIRKNIIF